MAALEGDRTNHAYLFSGPRGCGKTTSARILARCLNCANGPTATPCGTCDSCVELSRNGPGSLDVVEMDAASHGGVEDARDLRERAGFAPVRDRFKVFIIDEAHMVSPQGFNALLKVVEEPPPHVKFIFATTEPEKVIGTIRSRTHHYPFRLVPPGILEDYMAGLCEQENVTVDDGVLPLVVRAGTGSVRDSLSVLDQLIGGTGDNHVSYPTAVSLLGYTDGALLDETVDAVADSDGAALFASVAKVVESGLDPRRFVEDLLERLRDLVVLALAGSEARTVLGTIPEDQLGRMTAQAERLGASRASKSADLTNTALSEMVGATSPRLQLELLCARLLLASATVQANAAGAGGGAPAGSVADARAAARNFMKKDPKKGQAQDKQQAASPVSVPPASAPSTPAPVATTTPAPAPSSSTQQAADPASTGSATQPTRLVPEPPAQEQGVSSEVKSDAQTDQKPEQVQTPTQESERTVPPAPRAEPEGVAVQEPTEADNELLGTLRNLWRQAMADPRVPRGTSNFIRDNQGATSVLGGHLHFDFPTEQVANQFVDEGRSGGLEAVFSEILGQKIQVNVGVKGAPKATGRESADDAEGDRPVAPTSATQPPTTREEGDASGRPTASTPSPTPVAVPPVMPPVTIPPVTPPPGLIKQGASGPNSGAREQSNMGTAVPDRPGMAQDSHREEASSTGDDVRSSGEAVVQPAPEATPAPARETNAGSTGTEQGPEGDERVSPAAPSNQVDQAPSDGGRRLSAIERASARSAASRASAESPADSWGGSYGGGPSDFPGGEPTPPDDDEYGDPYDGLPSDLPDIVREDFPAPPPAEMPKFPAPPPLNAPSTGGPKLARDTNETFSRLSDYRGTVAPVEEPAPIENEEDTVSDDDPLATEVQGIGLQVVLDILGGEIIEEIEEEA